MRQSAMFLCASLLGILAGAALIGPVAIGIAIIFDSVMLGLYGLVTHDWQVAERPRPGGSTVAEIFERAARAS